MRDFVYHRPASLDEARRLALEEGAMLLAGGQTLLRDMKHGRHSPASLIDITSVVPSRIELHGGAITIGAGATHAEVARSAVLRERLPVLADPAGHIRAPAPPPPGTPPPQPFAIGVPSAARSRPPNRRATIPPPAWHLAPWCTQQSIKSSPRNSLLVTAGRCLSRERSLLP